MIKKSQKIALWLSVIAFIAFCYIRLNQINEIVFFTVLLLQLATFLLFLYKLNEIIFTSCIAFNTEKDILAILNLQAKRDFKSGEAQEFDVDYQLLPSKNQEVSTVILQVRLKNISIYNFVFFLLLPLILQISSNELPVLIKLNPIEIYFIGFIIGALMFYALRFKFLLGAYKFERFVINLLQ